MANPATAFPRNAMPGEPVTSYGSAPRAIGGTVQPSSPRGPKLAAPKTVKVKVKAHTRTRVVQPQQPAAPANPDQALINAAMNARYGPQEQALNAQLSQNARFNSGLPGWYANAQQEIRTLQAQGQQNSQQTLGQITGYASQPALPNATDQQAAGARNNLNAEFAAMFGRDANANSAAMDRLQAAYTSQQGNAANAANAQRLGLLGQQGALGQQKADYGLTYGAGLASAEQTQALKQQANDIAAKAFGIKADTLNKVQIPLANSLIKDRTAGEGVARSNARSKRLQVANQAMQSDRKYQLDVQKFGETQAKDNYQRQHGLGPYKPSGASSSGNRYTQTQLNHFDNQWNGAVALAKHLKAAGTYVDKQTKKTLPVTRDVVYSALLKEYKNDPEFAAAAANIIFGQSVDQHDLHVLATKGVHPVNSLANSAIGQTNKVVRTLAKVK